MDVSKYVESLVMLVAIVNPVAATFKFLALTMHETETQRKRTAIMAALTTGIVLTVAIFPGTQILKAFGISIPSFRIGGGILILIAALGMVNPPPAAPETSAPTPSSNIGVVPLGIPLLAGPGAISAVIIESQSLSDWTGYTVLTACVLVTTISVWLCFNLAGPLKKMLGKDGVDITTRVMGVLLLALAVEFILKGVVQAFPALKISPSV